MNCFHFSRYAAGVSKSNKNELFLCWYSKPILLCSSAFSWKMFCDWIQSTDLEWDKYKSLGGWNGFLIRPCMLTMRVLIILNLWWYLVQLSTTQTKVHILVGTRWLRIWAAFPTRQQFPLPCLLCHERSWTLSLYIAALGLKSVLSSCFSKAAGLFYYVWYFLIQLCNCSFCTGQLGEMSISESLASESCGK